MNNLKIYNEKRNFEKTREPKGLKKKSKSKKLKFVIQHHMARKDHYDLRLEYDGVYKSFAVPKGPSFNPSDKRLAIQVEDHPLSYGNFEGIIPKGEYGAGTVMLFDKGYWYPTNKAKVDFQNGPIKFMLNGKRIKGNYTLVKFKEDNWLLIKEKDEYVSKKKITSFKTSIKSGLSMGKISKNVKNYDLDAIKITHGDKVIVEKNITKEDIVNYYKLVAKRMMPFLDNRLISTVRCPNGQNGEKFFMKHLNNTSKNIAKKFVKNKDGKKLDYYYIKNIKGLIEEVQMNSYEFHIWGSKQNKINKPDILVFDFDPDEKVSLKKLRNGILDLKTILDELKLKSFIKTSGGKGYHVFIPLHSSSWQNTEKIAKNIAELMVSKWPLKYTINMRKEKRNNKIFIDYFRNKMGATSVCPYSIRLRKNAPISCPIYWQELNLIKPNSITIKNIKERLTKKDPWANFFIN